MKDGFPVSIAELLAAGQRPLPSEAVAIVLDVCRQVLERRAGPSVLPPISTGALFIDGGGRVAVAGGVPAEDDQTVPLLARVLINMLPAAGTPAGARVPSRLRLIAARAAAGEGPRLTVSRFAAALLRFGPPHPAAAVRALFRRWSGDSPADAGHWAENSVKASLLVDPMDPADLDDGPRPGVAIRMLRGVRRHSLAIGVMIAALVVLAGIGARYWLNAKEILPPLPVNPTIFLKEPTRPPRGGWELLADPSGLSVEAESAAPTPTDGPPVSANVACPEKRQPAASTPMHPGGTKGRAGLDAPFAHKPVE